MADSRFAEVDLERAPAGAHRRHVNLNPTRRHPLPGLAPSSAGTDGSTRMARASDAAV